MFETRFERARGHAHSLSVRDALAVAIEFVSTDRTVVVAAVGALGCWRCKR